MPRLKDVLTESGNVYVKVELGASSDKFDHKSGDTYHIKLKTEDMGESDGALESFMSKELKRSVSLVSGRGSKEKKVYVSAH